MKITTVQRAALVGVAKRAVTENWYGNGHDFQSGVVAVAEQLARLFPKADDASINGLSFEIGNEAMSELEEACAE
jgi:hypothetical protein